jgi:hypothetical protein
MIVCADGRFVCKGLHAKNSATGRSPQAGPVGHNNECGNEYSNEYSNECNNESNHVSISQKLMGLPA